VLPLHNSFRKVGEEFLNRGHSLHISLVPSVAKDNIEALKLVLVKEVMSLKQLIAMS
jgi:hypothetical protein